MKETLDLLDVSAKSFLTINDNFELSEYEKHLLQPFPTFIHHPLVTFYRKLQGYLEDDREDLVDHLATRTEIQIDDSLAFFYVARNHFRALKNANQPFVT